MTVSFEHIDAPDRRAEAAALDRIFRTATGWEPKLWEKIVGYDAYSYIYESRRSGESFATGFVLRSGDIALHVMPGYAEFEGVAERLGKHKRGQACWRLKRLLDDDESALCDLIHAGLDDLATQWAVRPS